MSEQVPSPPTTGNAQVDAALAELSRLHEAPVAEHHDRLAEVQDTLNRVLEDSRRPEPAMPQGLRPQGTERG